MPRWEWESGSALARDTWLAHPSVSTAITRTLRMHAHLMATMARAGLRMESSSARARGITADGAVDIMAADTTADVAMRAAALKDAVSQDGVSKDVQQPASMAQPLAANLAAAACLA